MGIAEVFGAGGVCSTIKTALVGGVKIIFGTVTRNKIAEYTEMLEKFKTITGRMEETLPSLSMRQFLSSVKKLNGSTAGLAVPSSRTLTNILKNIWRITSLSELTSSRDSMI